MSRHVVLESGTLWNGFQTFFSQNEQYFNQETFVKPQLYLKGTAHLKQHSY